MQGGSSSVSSYLSHKAYRKVLLHSAKYPHLAVNGILLGKRVPDDKEPGESKVWKKAKKLSAGNLFIADYLPLFHGHTLAPMLEAGFMMVPFVLFAMLRS